MSAPVCVPQTGFTDKEDEHDDPPVIVPDATGSGKATVVPGLTSHAKKQLKWSRSTQTWMEPR